ncbi:MAG: hypothetical protein HQK86_09880 [Nitrospinae bacterium]|nr:hypothetical protein [Nitrospinota bacterium]
MKVLKIEKRDMADGVTCYYVFGMQIFGLNSYDYPDDNLREIEDEPFFIFMEYFFNKYGAIGHLGYPALHNWTNALNHKGDFIRNIHTPNDFLSKIKNPKEVLVSIYSGSFFDGVVEYGEKSILFEDASIEIFKILFTCLPMEGCVAYYFHRGDHFIINEIEHSLSNFTSDTDVIQSILKSAPFFIRPEHDGCYMEVYVSDPLYEHDVLMAASNADNYITSNKWYIKNCNDLEWDGSDEKIGEMCYMMRDRRRK